MSKKESEILTGIAIGLLLGILFFGKLAFGAELSSEDVDMINRIVELESGNQCIEGRRCVAAVILNRCDKNEFPDSIREVISEPGQFTTYKHIDDVTPSWRSELATKLELESRSDHDVVFFRAGHYGVGQPAYKIQDHYFSTLRR